MFTKLLLCLAFLCLVSVHSGPVSCNSGSRYMGSLLEEDTNIFDPCADKDVCQFQCSSLIRGCSKTAYFADFMKHAKGSPSSISKVYIDVCIKRTTSSWVNEEIYKIAVQQESPTIKITYNKYKKNLRSLLDAFLNSRNEKFMYLAYFTEVLITLQKLCQQNSSL
jgi:hypothetical protein